MCETPLTVLIQFAAKRLSQTLEESFQSAGLNKLRPPCGQILGLLHANPGMSATDLQNRLCLCKSTVSEALGELASLGLIEYVVSTEDRREKVIIETAEGKRYQENAWGILTQFRGEVLKGLSDSELQALRDMLNKIIENTKGGTHDQ